MVPAVRRSALRPRLACILAVFLFAGLLVAAASWSFAWVFRPNCQRWGGRSLASAVSHPDDQALGAGDGCRVLVRPVFRPRHYGAIAGIARDPYKFRSRTRPPRLPTMAHWHQAWPSQRHSAPHRAHVVAPVPRRKAPPPPPPSLTPHPPPSGPPTPPPLGRSPLARLRRLTRQGAPARRPAGPPYLHPRHWAPACLRCSCRVRAVAARRSPLRSSASPSWWTPAC